MAADGELSRDVALLLQRKGNLLGSQSDNGAIEQLRNDI